MKIIYEVGDKVKLKHPTTEYAASREYRITKVVGYNTHLYFIRIKGGKKDILVHQKEITPINL